MGLFIYPLHYVSYSIILILYLLSYYDIVICSLPSVGASYTFSNLGLALSAEQRSYIFITYDLPLAVTDSATIDLQLFDEQGITVDVPNQLSALCVDEKAMQVDDSGFLTLLPYFAAHVHVTFLLVPICPPSPLNHMNVIILIYEDDLTTAKSDCCRRNFRNIRNRYRSIGR